MFDMRHENHRSPLAKIQISICIMYGTIYYRTEKVNKQ